MNHLDKMLVLITWDCDSYNHPVVANPVKKVTLLTCKPPKQVETSKFQNLAETATGRWLESFGLANVRSEFVVEAHLLCVHGEQRRLNYRYENLNKDLKKLFVEVSAMFLKWYLFEYVKPTVVLASCGPDIFRKMLEMLEDQEFVGGCCCITYKNHTIGFYGTFTSQGETTTHHPRWWNSKRRFNFGKEKNRDVQGYKKGVQLYSCS